ncbi:hypothetical protein ACOTHV_15820, partial [Achromobacter xylosoxidans]
MMEDSGSHHLLPARSANANRKTPRKLKKAARAAGFERAPQDPPPTHRCSQEPQAKKTAPAAVKFQRWSPGR